MIDPDLAAALRAHLDEDEAVARAATPGPWLALDGGVVSHDDPSDEDGHGTWPVASTETTRERADRVHIARWNPARVLAEIAAKRQILDLLAEDHLCPDPEPCRHLIALAHTAHLDMAALFTTPQITTDPDGRHWHNGVEYDAVTVRGELTYMPKPTDTEARPA